MTRLAVLLLRLYPGGFQRRYRAEVEALIEDCGGNWFDVTDLFKEAIRMQLTSAPFGRMAIALGLTGLLTAALISALNPPAYVSHARIEVSRIPDTASVAVPWNDNVLNLAKEALSRPALSKVIQDPGLDLYASERQSRPMEDVVDKMRRNIQVRLLPASGPAWRLRSGFSLAFAYPDPDKAQRALQALAARFEAASLEASLYGALVETPSRPSEPSGPGRNILMPTGAAAGIALAALLKLFGTRASLNRGRSD